jgi:hypothetical protein
VVRRREEAAPQTLEQIIAELPSLEEVLVDCASVALPSLASPHCSSPDARTGRSAMISR